MNKDREVVLFLPAVAAICLLDFNLSVGAIPNAWTPRVLAAVIPARSNFLTPTFKKTLVKGLPYTSFFLFFFRSQLLDPRSEVNNQGVHAVGHCESFSNELTRLILQEATRRNRLALSLLTDNFEPFPRYLFFHFLHHLRCHFSHYPFAPPQ